MLFGIACGIKKFVLIFNTSLESPHDPIYVCDPRKFGVMPDTDIPVVLAYNMSHYESLHPSSNSDISKTSQLVQQYLEGGYGFGRKDLPFLLDLNSNDFDTDIPLSITTDKTEYLTMLNESLPDQLKGRRPSQMTLEEKRDYRAHLKTFTQKKLKTVKVKVLKDNEEECEIIVDNIIEVEKDYEKHIEVSNFQIEDELRMKEIMAIKAKERTYLEKKELNRLRLRVFRQNENNKNSENEKRRKSRENEEKRKAENEKRRNARQNEEKRRTENEKEAGRKRIVAQEKRKSQKRIAVNVSQYRFKEKDIDSNIRSSYLGDLKNKAYQCKYCYAYRFRNERNFCCSQGDIILPKIPEPPEDLKELFNEKRFTENIRGYNNILAMASIGCTTPDSVRGPNFKIQGKVHHKIGSLIPSDEENPKFLQLYFYDSDEATVLRHKIMPKLDKTILTKLTRIIEENNSFGVCFW